MFYRGIWRTLIVLQLFVAAMAIYGGIRLLAGAANFGISETLLRGSPFSNFQGPAIALLVGVGGTSLLGVAALIWSRLRLRSCASLVAGVVLIAFEVTEAYAMGLRNWQQPLMLVVGLLVVALALTQFSPNSADETGHGDLGRSLQGRA
jgi:hypothetical protein